MPSSDVLGRNSTKSTSALVPWYIGIGRPCSSTTLDSPNQRQKLRIVRSSRAICWPLLLRVGRWTPSMSMVAGRSTKTCGVRNAPRIRRLMAGSASGGVTACCSISGTDCRACRSATTVMASACFFRAASSLATYGATSAGRSGSKTINTTSGRPPLNSPNVAASQPSGACVSSHGKRATSRIPCAA